MHIYAHILAGEDDDTARRGLRKLRGPYLCKCSRIRLPPCATFLTGLSPSKLTSLQSRLNLPIVCVIGEKRGGRKVESKESEREGKRKIGAAGNEKSRGMIYSDGNTRAGSVCNAGR